MCPSEISLTLTAIIDTNCNRSCVRFRDSLSTMYAIHMSY